MRGQVTTLAPQVAGHVAEVLVQDHDMVKAGDLLVWIDDRTAREKVAQAETGLAAQQVALASWDQDKRSAEVSITAAAAQVGQYLAAGAGRHAGSRDSGIGRRDSPEAAE